MQACSARAAEKNQNPTSEWTEGDAPHGRYVVNLSQGETSGPLVDAFLCATPPSPCFLGLSIRNKMSNGSRLEALIPWVARRTQTLTIVIGDYIHRHDLVAFDGIPISDAARKAFSLGARATRAARRIVGDRAGCRVLSSADLTETAECKRILRVITDYYSAEPTFMRDVTQQVIAFAARSVPESTAARNGQLLGILKDYVLEEIAMFLYLHDAGYAIEVYPGPDLTIMRKAAIGLYPRFPIPCPWRTHISVHVSAVRSRV